MMRNFFVHSVIVFMLLAPSVSGASVVAYNNLGTNDSYSQGGNWFGTISMHTYQLGSQFTSSASGYLDSIVLGMTQNSGNNVVTLSLLSDNGGLFGTLLWSETFTSQLAHGAGSVSSFLNLNGPMLTEGATYWLTASTDTSSNSNWARNSTDVRGRIALNHNGAWSFYGNDLPFAMRASVNPVPLPCTVFLFGSGLVGLLGIGRKVRA
jgi:hypothetical protein